MTYSVAMEYISEDPRKKKSQPATPRHQSNNELHELPLKRDHWIKSSQIFVSLAMDYLVRFAQLHETFRRPELQACATLAGVDIEFITYNEYVWYPFYQYWKRPNISILYEHWFTTITPFPSLFLHDHPQLAETWLTSPVTILCRKTTRWSSGTGSCQAQYSSQGHFRALGRRHQLWRATCRCPSTNSASLERLHCCPIQIHDWLLRRDAQPSSEGRDHSILLIYGVQRPDPAEKPRWGFFCDGRVHRRRWGL